MCCFVVSVHVEADCHLFVKLIKRVLNDQKSKLLSYEEVFISVCSLNCDVCIFNVDGAAGAGGCFQVSVRQCGSGSASGL